MSVDNLTIIDARPGASRKSFSSLADSWNDVAEGFLKWRIWTALSWAEFRNTYNRTLFGVAWVAISFAIFIGIKLVIFGAVLKPDNAASYNLYFAVGLCMFQYMSQSITAASAVFSSSKNWILNDRLPFTVYVFKAILREFYNFAFSISIVAGLMVYYAWNGQYSLPGHAWVSLLALATFLFNAVWVKMLLGMMGTRYRDVGQLIQAMMRPMFFLLPIFWYPERMGRLFDILWWNPLYHFMEIFRNPLIDPEINYESWIYVGVLTLIGWTVTLAVFAKYRNRIVLWL